MTLRKSDKIFVAGHRGLMGRALVKRLKERGYENIVVRTRAELDLADAPRVSKFFEADKPDVVILAAAKVGGIHANNTLRADFLYQNLRIQDSVIWGAHENDIPRLIFLGSSCIYPKLAPQPMPEDCLLTSALEVSNRPYAIAKIAGLELVDGLRKQYGRDYFSAMPTNLYGPGDNFDLESSHVLPALLRKIIEAKTTQKPSVSIWGTGRPLREFMYSEDCADAILHVAEATDFAYFEKQGLSHINIGSGQEISIRELALLICEIVGYKGELVFDSTKLDGTPRKLLDVSKLTSLEWIPSKSLAEGIKSTLNWYLENSSNR